MKRGSSPILFAASAHTAAADHHYSVVIPASSSCCALGLLPRGATQMRVAAKVFHHGQAQVDDNKLQNNEQLDRGVPTQRSP